MPASPSPLEGDKRFGGESISGLLCSGPGRRLVAHSVAPTEQEDGFWDWQSASDLAGRLGGTRTPNLLIRRTGRAVRCCPSSAFTWGAVLRLSLGVRNRLPRWQQSCPPPPMDIRGGRDNCCDRCGDARGNRIRPARRMVVVALCRDVPGLGGDLPLFRLQCEACRAGLSPSGRLRSGGSQRGWRSCQSRGGECSAGTSARHCRARRPLLRLPGTRSCAGSCAGWRAARSAQP